MMNMNTVLLPITLISLTLTLFTTTTATTTVPTKTTTIPLIPDVLTYFKLPRGLFPANVDSFEVKYDSEPKEEVKLTIKLKEFEKPCFATTPEFDAQYDNTIIAILSETKVSNLQGFKYRPKNSTQFKYRPKNSEQFVVVTEVQAFFEIKYQFKTEQGFSDVLSFSDLEEPPSCRNDAPQLLGTIIDVVSSY